MTSHDSTSYIEAAARALGDRHTLLILWSALHGITRFQSYRRVCGTSEGTLRRRLQRLEQAGLVVRTPAGATMTAARFALTPKGGGAAPGDGGAAQLERRLVLSAPPETRP